MNRELKFRVWDKPRKQFINSKEFYGDDYSEKSELGEAFLDFNGKLKIARYPIGNGDNSADSVFSEMESDNYTIQQYTGIQDSNKKYIYDGDIVIYTINKKTYMSVVMWENFGWVTRDYPEGSTIPLTTGIEYTIIGNIFENPELLK